MRCKACNSIMGPYEMFYKDSEGVERLADLCNNCNHKAFNNGSVTDDENGLLEYYESLGITFDENNLY